VIDHPEGSGAEPNADGGAAQEVTAEPQTASWVPQPASSAAQDSAGSVTAEHPELPVAGAFAGGLLLALILRRLAR
jgi:hypothetical protein